MKPATKKTIIGILATVILSINANAITDALKVKIVNGTTSDETVIRFLPSATTGFDGSYDAYKMFSPSPSVPAAFTAIDAANKLAVNALPALTASTDVDLFIHIKVAGNYTLQASELGAFLPTTKIILEDKQEGVSYLFKAGATVVVPMTVNTVNSASRFVIHFRPAAGGTSVTSTRFDVSARAIDINEQDNGSDSDVDGTVITARSAAISNSEETAALTTSLQDGNLVFTAELENPASVTIMVYNISGQQVYNFSANGLSSLSETAALNTSGTYIVYSIINNTPHSQKFSVIK